MHIPYFVKIKKSNKIKNYKDALAKTYDTLIDNDFVIRDGYWSGGKADYFDIGKTFDDLFPKLLNEKRETSKEAIEKNGVRELTEYLISQLKEKYIDKEMFDVDNMTETSIGSLTNEDIGDWIVVVDYHI